MSKIKVLQIIGNACRGGIETYVLNYYQQMNNDFEFTFACYDDSPYINYDEIKKLGGNVKLVPNIKHLSKFKKELKKILLEDHYEIVHSHLNALSVFPLGVAKKCGYPIRVATSHTSTNKKEGIKHIIKVFLAKFSRQNANKYQAVSKTAAEYLYGKKHLENIDYVSASVNLQQFQFNEAKRNELRTKFGLEDKYVIGNIGRLCSSKNQKFILKIAKKLLSNQDFQFVIIGDGNKKNQLDKYIKKNNLSNVLMIPNQSNIYDFYNMFDLFIFPSLYEGFGLVSLEAQANGLYCLQSTNFTDEALVDAYGKSINLNLDQWVLEISKKPSRRDNVDKVLNSRFSNTSQNTLSSLYSEYLKSKNL